MFTEGPGWLRDAEVAGSNPVSPTFHKNGPFGEKVRRLSLFYTKTYVTCMSVQTDHLQDLPFSEYHDHPNGQYRTNYQGRCQPACAESIREDVALIEHIHKNRRPAFSAFTGDGL